MSKDEGHGAPGKEYTDESAARFPLFRPKLARAVTNDLTVAHVYDILGDIRRMVGDAFKIAGNAHDMAEIMKLIGAGADIFLEFAEYAGVDHVHLIIIGAYFPREFGVNIHQGIQAVSKHALRFFRHEDNIADH